MFLFFRLSGFGLMTLSRNMLTNLFKSVLSLIFESPSEPCDSFVCNLSNFRVFIENEKFQLTLELYLFDSQLTPVHSWGRGSLLEGTPLINRFTYSFPFILLIFLAISPCYPPRDHSNDFVNWWEKPWIERIILWNFQGNMNAHLNGKIWITMNRKKGNNKNIIIEDIWKQGWKGCKK